MTDPVDDVEPEGADPSELFVQSLARGLQVIRAFDEAHPSMILSEVSRRVGLSRAAVRRLLATLQQLGYVWTDGKSYELTPRVLELGYSYLSGLELPELAHPHLEQLSAETRLSTSVSVLVGEDIAYVARVSTRRIMSVAINIGTRFPAYATSMGRVLLADLDQDDLRAVLDRSVLLPLTPLTLTSRPDLEREIEAVRAKGWAMVDQELEEGLRSLAAPIRRNGRVIAAVNVATHVGASSADLLDTVLPPLLEAAQRITDDVAFMRRSMPYPLALGPRR